MVAWSQSTPSKQYSVSRAVTWVWTLWSWFLKNPYRTSFNRAIFFLCVVRTWFNVHCVSLILKKLFSTQSISVSAIENFLRWLEVSPHLQNSTQSRELWHISWDWVLFWRSRLTSSCRIKFSITLTDMIWVLKSFSRIRRTQRTLNQVRKSHRKKYGAAKTGPVQ